MSKRKQQPVERKLIVEYVEKTYPKPLAKFYNVRLGEPPAALKAAHPGLPDSYFKVWHAYADAVIVLEKEIHLIEAKVYKPEGAVSQLERYAYELPRTASLKMWSTRPIKKILVTARAPPQLLEFAGRHGIEVIIYRPAWVVPILQRRNLM
jgi:hypothetical protein